MWSDWPSSMHRYAFKTKSLLICLKLVVNKQFRLIINETEPLYINKIAIIIHSFFAIAFVYKSNA